jgi:hypothetical protein
MNMVAIGRRADEPRAHHRTVTSSVVDKGFLIWLDAQDRKQLLEMVDLPTLVASGQSELGV